MHDSSHGETELRERIQRLEQGEQACQIATPRQTCPRRNDPKMWRSQPSSCSIRPNGRWEHRARGEDALTIVQLVETLFRRLE